MKHIAVSDLIRSRDIAAHNQAHDAYFAQYPDYKPLARKPFFDLNETVPALAELSAMLELAQLSRGLQVLDYGCGTGWLARSLAYLGIEATGVDVSARAIDWAREGAASDPLCAGLPLRYEVIDGVRMPYADASFDRVVCFSAFHHVADQAGTLAEIARVLRPGGRAVFSEPGTGHSDSPAAQAEMSQYGVIENDIEIEEIALHARKAGFGEPLMAVFNNRAMVLPLAVFQRATAPGTAEGASVGASFLAQAGALRTFCLIKEGIEVRDSRAIDGLAGVLKMEMMGRTDGTTRWRARWHNTGTRAWRPAQPALTGSVAVGVTLRKPDGLREARIALGSEAVAPGARGETEFTLDTQGWETVRFDLVSEWVAWFGNLGSATVSQFSLDSGAPSA